MNDLTDRRREVLERGLAEFDAATRRRRTRARAGRSLAAIVAVAACAVVVLRTVAPAVPALPRYVEVISGEGKNIELADMDEDVYRATQELGIDISRPERGSAADDRERERRRERATF